VRVKRTCQYGTCREYSLLYRINAIDNKWAVRATRLDQHAPNDPHVMVSTPYLNRGKIVRRNVEIPSRLEWDTPIADKYRWAVRHNPHYAEELKVKYG
jgi:hypothetical protein